MMKAMKRKEFSEARNTPKSVSYFSKLEKSYQDGYIIVEYCKLNDITIGNADDDYSCLNGVDLPEYNKLDKFKGMLSDQDKQHLRNVYIKNVILACEVMTRPAMAFPAYGMTKEMDHNVNERAAVDDLVKNHIEDEHRDAEAKEKTVQDNLRVGRGGGVSHSAAKEKREASRKENLLHQSSERGLFTLIGKDTLCVYCEVIAKLLQLGENLATQAKCALSVRLKEDLVNAYEILEEPTSYINGDDILWQNYKRDLGINTSADLEELENDDLIKLRDSCNPIKKKRISRLLNVKEY